MNQLDLDTIELLESKIRGLRFNMKAIEEVKQILMAMLGLLKRNL